MIPFAALILPLWVAVSQWILLFTLGFFVIVAYRQLGYMLRLKNIGSERDGLAIGEKAPVFTHLPISSNRHQQPSPEMHFDPHGQWSLLLFADPGCASCQRAVAALERLAPTLPQMQILVATTAEPQAIEAIEQFRNASVPISRVANDVSSKMYHTLTTPFAYIIDPQGFIKAKGIASDESALRKLIRVD